MTKIHEIKCHLNKLVNFFEPLQQLANSHFSVFFAEDSWTRHVPKNIQAELCNMDSVLEFIQLYPYIIKNGCSKEFVNKYPNLSSILNLSNNLSLKNKNKYLKSLVALEDFFKGKGCSSNSDFKFNDFMSPKKRHEVRVTSKVTALLADFSKSSHIVDVGGGKGYLSSVLALQHSYKVLSLDISKVKTSGAGKWSEKLAVLWKEGVFDESNDEIHKTNKTFRKEFIKNNYKVVVTNVLPHTNIRDLLKANFNENIHGVTLVGLHTCGNLSSTCLRLFLNSKDITSIVNIGCCYHYLNEKPVDDAMAVEYGFPMSEFLGSKNLVMGRNSLNLAAYSLDRIRSQTSCEFSPTSLFYRAILETVIREDKNFKSNGKGRVKKLAKTCENFYEYLLKATQKLNLNFEVTQNKSAELYNAYIDQKPLITAFFLLRVSLAPVVESIVLLDRLLFLYENGIHNAYLVQLFNLRTSPRGYGLIAWKSR